jgi:Lrp/AsnC family transcriptional regulator for asnA, asnC and gidA
MKEIESRARNTVKPAIDQIDSRIIAILQKDGRLPNIEIAKMLDVSEATVRGRIRRLIDSGYMQIVAVSNPFMLGFEMTGDLYIHVEMKKLDHVIAELEKMNELWYIIMTTGEASINAEFVVKTREDLNDLVYNRISRIDGVLRIETSLIMQYVKRRYDYGTALE